MSTDLSKIGWNDTLAKAWETITAGDLVPGRIIADFGTNYKIALPAEITAEISGKLKHDLETHQMPKAGDWVAVQLLDGNHGMIHTVLPRSSEIIRRRAGEKFQKQVLATNIDLAFLVQALDNDFSPERLCRYIFQLQKAAIKTVVVLNKSDIVTDLDEKLGQLESFDFEIIVASAQQNKGIDAIAEKMKPGMTAVFLGSSGVGKSTITNMLLGEQRQRTKAVRDEDSKGRHTTTHRELFILPHGGLIIDTPGLRELRLWGSEDDLDTTYPEIEALARHCQFSNCSHTTEAGCAIRNAISAGTLDKAKLASYYSFQKELYELNTKVDTDTQLERDRHHRRMKKPIARHKRPQKKKK